jgi:hypothetical protein
MGSGTRVRKPRLRLGRLPLAFVALAVVAGLSIPVVAKMITVQAAPPADAANCETATIQSAVHLADGTVDSAALNTSGSFTPTNTFAPITRLPAFCDVDL